jgi:hypothetical protein
LDFKCILKNLIEYCFSNFCLVDIVKSKDTSVSEKGNRLPISYKVHANIYLIEKIYSEKSFFLFMSSYFEVAEEDD